MQDFARWLRALGLHSLAVGASFPRHAAALQLLEVLHRHLAPIWSLIDPAGKPFAWDAVEVQALLALFQDAFDVNRLAAFNLLQSVPWELNGEAAFVAALSVGSELDLLRVDNGTAAALFQRGLSETAYMSQAYSHSGALLLALVFARCVQQRSSARNPAQLGRSEKSAQLQKIVDRHAADVLEDHTAAETVFVSALLAVLRQRVRKSEERGGVKLC